MEDQGPFDRILGTEPRRQRDRAATIIVAICVALGLVLLVLVLPPISILDDDGQSGIIGPITSEIREELPPPPDGFEAVSALFDLSSNEPVDPSARPRLTVSLSVPVNEGELLSLFTYRDGTWRRLGDATALAEGDAAQGEVPVLPENVAVFRPAERVRFVQGSLPPGAELDPRALAALTTLNPMGFGPAPDGRVSGGPVELPQGLAVAVAPTISASSPSEIQALNTILASSELRAAHVQAILDLVDQNEFAGVDLDYHAVDPSRTEDFKAFVEELSGRLRAEARSLSLTLPLPVRVNDEWDTRGFDWKGLAPLVDAIKLPVEPEQDRYYERMEAALAYLVPDRIASSKLLLTVSPLSRERGVEGVRSLSMTEALSLASVPVLQTEGPVAPDSVVEALGQNLATELGATGLHWDEAARAVVFRYTGGGGDRTVWLANAFSETFKLDLARRYELGGVAVEDASREREDANVWPAVVRYAQTGEVVLVKPNAELLNPRWTVSGGSLEGDAGSLARWNVPAEAGTYTITLIVSDGVTRVGQELQVPVEVRRGAAPP